VVTSGGSTFLNSLDIPAQFFLKVLEHIPSIGSLADVKLGLVFWEFPVTPSHSNQGGTAIAPEEAPELNSPNRIEVKHNGPGAIGMKARIAGNALGAQDLVDIVTATADPRSNLLGGQAGLVSSNDTIN
jgi:hypothetical protein